MYFSFSEKMAVIFYKTISVLPNLTLSKELDAEIEFLKGNYRFLSRSRMTSKSNIQRTTSNLMERNSSFVMSAMLLFS